jgi:hypothetical protein
MTEIAPAGAMPVVGGATPPQTPAQPASGAPAPTPEPATGYPDGLGDAGKRALDDMKAAKKAAEAEARAAREELDRLRTATATDAEKALIAARKEGASEVLGKVQAQIRRSEVRAALAAAGLPGNFVDLAARSDEFASLKVTDDGEVEGLHAAVEAFRKAMPDLFTKPGARPVGESGLGPRGTPTGAGTDLNTWIRKAAGRA